MSSPDYRDFPISPSSPPPPLDLSLDSFDDFNKTPAAPTNTILRTFQKPMNILDDPSQKSSFTELNQDRIRTQVYQRKPTISQSTLKLIQSDPELSALFFDNKMTTSPTGHPVHSSLPSLFVQ